MIKPLYNNVLLKKVEASNETSSGIIISQKEKNEDVKEESVEHDYSLDLFSDLL